MITVKGNITEIPLDSHDNLISISLFQCSSWKYNEKYVIDKNGNQILLNNNYTSMNGDKAKCSIILVEEEIFIGYYFPENEQLFIDEDGIDVDFNNIGISNKTINEITSYLGWDEYKVYVHFYICEDACLCIERINNTGCVET